MPSPGDLLTGDYQFQLGQSVSTQLYGKGHNGVSIDLSTANSFAGLGGPDAKTQDVTYNFGDGAYGNPDYVSLRLITIPIQLVSAGSPSTVMTNFKALTLAWVPQTSDVALAFQLGGQKFYVMGRPRGLKEDWSQFQFGVIRALLRFDCPSPTITYL